MVLEFRKCLKIVRVKEGVVENEMDSSFLACSSTKRTDKNSLMKWC